MFFQDLICEPLANSMPQQVGRALLRELIDNNSEGLELVAMGYSIAVLVCGLILRFDTGYLYSIHYFTQHAYNVCFKQFAIV